MYRETLADSLGTTGGRVWHHLDSKRPTLSDVVTAGLLGFNGWVKGDAGTITAETEQDPKTFSCCNSRKLESTFLDELQLKRIPVTYNGECIGGKWSLKWEISAEEFGDTEFSVQVDVMDNAVHWKRRQMSEGIVLP